MSEPVTAETITDEQIRELAELDGPDGDTTEHGIALGSLKRTRIGTPVTPWRIERAREYLARAWNARQGKEGR